MSVTGWLDVAKDFGSLALEEPYDKLVGLADTVGDGVAAGYDYLMGDKEHAKEHAVDAVWDAGGLVAPPGLDKGIDGLHAWTNFGKEVSKPSGEVEHDEAGTGAKWGALAGLIGPGALLGPLGCALIGGGIGALTAPKAGHAFDGAKVGGGLGALGAGLIKNATTPPEQTPPDQTFGPPKPTPQQTVYDHLMSHPFGNYAF